MNLSLLPSLRTGALLSLLLPLASSSSITDWAARRPAASATKAAPTARPLQGAKPDPAVIAQFGLYDNAKLQSLITARGKAMTAISDRPGDYGFTIVDSPIINAFATPDGHVYFTRGIMAYFNDEAQFSGVLGHELGHITAQHGKKQQTRSTIAGIGMILGSVLAPRIMQSVGGVAQQVVGLGMLKYGRDDENEADGLGVKYSTKIGYDASHMADFFQTLERTEAQSGSSIPTFLSTHPNSADRYTRVKQLAAQAKQSVGNRTLAVNRDAYLRSIEGLTFGEDPRQGFVESGVFYHPDLKFRFPIPSGWKSQNAPDKFQMAEPNGKALLVFLGASGSSLDEAGQSLAKSIGLASANASKTTINGFPALVFEGDQQATDQSSTPAHVLAQLIQDGKSIYAFVGLAAPASFSTYAPQFQRAAQGYARLTDANKLNRQPEHIHIRTATGTQTLASALASAGIPSSRYEELAIVNGMKTTDKLPKGMLYKVVGK
ncbi:M48 family metalloprotease [Hymenobacter negativus]|uniref:M48 family metalloprotease n=1 Tax=Hymenobacter negativus TaxID=2795026 RepID=A0ABS0Q1U9_9BACT|nr:MULTISPECIES: M48 family metalloprotease [Bacteria]MBH8556497.1 M48 family metalloprotease [Hymenobacter negativus]MBH8571018.1 M48 family metalloprotease [Hymenobacter negativus]MBR7210755.1 M48 family metalloprotease [Microvirga sp. STS02]